MIEGIINVAALIDERPATVDPPAGNSRGFDRALRHASHQAPEPNASSQTREVTRSDPRARDSFGDSAADRSRNTGEENVAESRSSEENAASTETPEDKKTGELADTNVAIPVDITAQVRLAGTLKAGDLRAPLQGGGTGGAFVFNEEITAQSSLQAQPSIQAQIGDAAYRLSEHGIGERKFAELAGKPLPTAQVVASAETAMTQARKPVAEPLNPEQTQGIKDLMELALKGQNQQNPANASAQAIPDEGAQVRNPALMQYAQLMEKPDGITARASGDAPRTEGLPTLFERADLIPGLAGTGLSGAIAGRMAAEGASTRDQATQILNRVVQEARWVINNKSSEVTFKLHPETLGEVLLKVTRQDGVLKLDMTVENQVVKSLIESRIEDLRDQLVADDLHNGEFMFNVDVNKGDQNPGSESQLAGENEPVIPGSAQQQQSDPQLVQLTAMRPVWGTTGTGIYA